MTLAESFGWEPAEALGPGRAAQVAGVEAVIWAKAISGFDDPPFLLLPRLPVSPTRPGVLRKPPPGPITMIASLGTAGYRRETTLPTLASPQWTGFNTELQESSKTASQP